jgi:hypothetical protein
VETATLVEDDRTVCRYRTIRQVAGVDDVRVEAGGASALIRRPRLGAVVEVEGCVEACDEAASWSTIYPDPEDVAPSARPAQPLRHEVRSRAAEQAGSFWDE